MEMSGREVERESDDAIYLSAMAGENWDELVKFAVKIIFTELKICLEFLGLSAERRSKTSVPTAPRRAIQ